MCVSLYLPFDRDIVRDTETIENILQLTKGEGLILALDSNARSKLWFDKHTNARGRTMKEYIITRDLHIINTKTGIPSFETNRGSSWIDLTLCNSKLTQNIKRWTCREEESCAEHKIICFDIESRDPGRYAKHFIRTCYNTKVDNWGTFECHFIKNLVQESECQTDPHNLTECDTALSHKVKHSTDIGGYTQTYLSYNCSLWHDVSSTKTRQMSI